MKIIDIWFDHVSKNDCCICDNCGQYITNVYTITYDNGLKLQYKVHRGRDKTRSLAKNI